MRFGAPDAQMTDEEAHDELVRLVDEHHATMDMPEMDIRPEAQGEPPASVPAQVAKAITGAKPPIDLSKPLGYRPPKDTEIAGLQADAKQGRDAAQLDDVVTSFTQRPTNFLDYAQRLGGGGVSPPPARAKEGIDEGDRAIADLEARRKSDAGIASGAEESDPNSSTSQAWRSVLVQVSPALADQLKGANAHQMKQIAPYLEKQVAEQVAASKGKSTEALQAEQLKKLQNENGNFDATKAGKDSKAALDLQLEQAKLDALKRKGHHSGAQVVAGDLTTIADPGERATVQAIIEGRAKAPDPGSKFGQHIMGLVAQMDPKFDATSFGAYKDVKEKLSKSDEVVALNTAYGHISRAKANIPDNFDSQALNRIKRAYLTGVGSDTLTPFETDVKIAADELAKAYGNNSEAGRSTIEHLLEPGQSKAQLVARLAEVEELLSSKLGSYQHQFERVAPKGAAPFQVISKENSPQAGPVDIVDKNGHHYNPPAADADALRAELKAEGLL